MNRILPSLCIPILTLLALVAGQTAHAQNQWVGGGGNQNWSTTGNWSAASVPTSSSSVIFTNSGAASAAGTVDNVVDSSLSIASLQFANTNNTGTGAGFFHTTQIPAGQTLTVLGDLRVGFNPDIANCTINDAFTGAGTLLINNPSAGLNVSQGDTGNAAQAILNLTNLNTFIATNGGITVGVYNTPNPAVARQKGFLYLAKTNLINLIGNTSRGIGNEGQIEVGENLGNGSNVQVPMYLGIVNTIYVNSITIGGDKQGSGALMAFNPVFVSSSPSATFRGTNGSASRVASWKIGDNSNQTTTGSGTAGTVDFTGGTLDTLVDSMFVGLGESGASSGTGNGAGTFTFNAGTNNVNTLYLGYRVATGGNSAPNGTLNVNGTGTLVVNNAICMSFYAGGSGLVYGSATLNINGGTVQAATITNGLATDSSFDPIAATFPVNVSVNNGTLGITSIQGVIGTPRAPLNNFSISGSTLQLKVSGVQTNIETYTLTVNGSTNVVNISSLPPINSYPATFPLIGFQSLVGNLNLGLGSLPAASPSYQGSLTSDANTIYLVLTSGPVGALAETWTGAANGNWDTSTVNWNLGGAAAYTDGNAVLFDDTATGPTAVNLTTTLSPASTTVSNNTLPYAFGGVGLISGSGGLVKSGSGTLLVTNAGNNSFLGNITINAGTVQVGNGGSLGSLPSTGTVLDNGALVFNRANSVVVPNVISGLGTLTQNGSNVLTLTASNDFSGTALVNNGTLLLNGVLSGTLTNAVGGTVGGSGANAGAVNISGTIQPSSVSGTPSTFSAGTLTLSAGATPKFTLNPTDTTIGNGVNDLLQVNGNLAANGNTIALSIAGLPQSGNTYRLINYGGSLSGSFNSSATGTHFTATVNQGTANQINVTLGGSGANLRWNSSASTAWDIGAATNWLNLGSSLTDVFYAGDSVTFDDNSSVTNITIANGLTVYPAAITNNSTRNYSITGSGRIGGTGRLTKAGSSTLTLSTPNTNYTGNIAIQAGTVRVGNSSALGSGTVTVNSGATLDLNGAGIGAVTVTTSGSGVGGNGAVVSTGADQIHAMQNLVLAGDTTVGGSGRWDLRFNGVDNATLNSADAGAYKLTKVSTNYVGLVNVIIDQNLGNVDIQNGTLSLELNTLSLSPTWAADTGHTITIGSNGILSFNSTASTALGRSIVINGGTFNNSGTISFVNGPITLQGNTTNNDSSALEIDSVMSGSGSLTKLGAANLTLTVANTYAGSTVIGAGKLLLTGSGAIANSTNITVSAGTMLDVSARTDGALTLVNGQTLQGGGTVNGLLTVNSGATLAPGTSAATGLLTVSNNVTLNGTNVMKLNGATNDVLWSAGGIAYGGVLKIQNIGGSLAVGNSFRLFTATNYSGSFTITPSTPGAGLAWDTSTLTNGVLGVVSGIVPQPRITTINLSGSSLVINGTNGTAGQQYEILTSTNVATPLTNWVSVLTNTFGGNNFSVTNSVNPSAAKNFYILRVP